MNQCNAMQYDDVKCLYVLTFQVSLPGMRLNFPSVPTRKKGRSPEEYRDL